MEMQEYQRAAHKTSLFPAVDGGEHDKGRIYAALGIGNEAGEVQGKVKKMLRGDTQDLAKVREQILEELGDVFWYLAENATQWGITLSQVAKRNLEKLADRQERGVIQGNGDKR